MDYNELSKEISYALRHAPWEYELEMDEEGWVLVDQLIESLRLEKRWENISVDDLLEMIERSDKKRHEIKKGRIRALYGHSIPMKIIKEEKEPPEFLYHGTARRFLESIEKMGLLPKGRQYVHLSQDIETALSVGMRHDNRPCILVVEARKAYSESIKFYYGNEKVWLADYVPSEYVKLLGEIRGNKK